MQLYEGYSHALYNISVAKQDPVDYFQRYVAMLTHGWTITDSEGAYHMDLPLSRLVLGLGNGWAYNSGKFLFLESETIQSIYKGLSDAGLSPRGWMFWDILDEGMPAGVEGKPFYMTKTLNQVMNIRQIVEAPNDL